jgi:hypothetical protein
MSAPIVATYALDLDMVKALTFVVDELEKELPAWAHNALSNLLYGAEDLILGAPAPDKDVACWKMGRLADIADACIITPEIAAQVALVQDDIARFLTSAAKGGLP